MSIHDDQDQGLSEAEEFAQFEFERNNPPLYDEGNGAGGIGGGFDDDDDHYDEDEEELDSFEFDDDGEGDFDDSGRALDINPYGGD
ncbi:hypothetical protein [Aeromonas dhakensis]|uniref:hypothetical protein n=1 Tax=Aeromonas dhakensis TaxID=196024 RepID=UPI00398834DB